MTYQNRLPKPMGLLIDRQSPLKFSFEGQSYQAFQGDTIASGLLANGQWLMSRSFKYHRPRGPLTMAGQDGNTLVQLPNEPNVLADRYPLENHLTAMGQNYKGSLAKDKDALLGHFGRFMPVGFYYRAFYKPMGVWDKWEPFIRQKAGLGFADLTFKPVAHDKMYLFHDVAVIGAGPAGLAAALKAADGGAKVLLVEENALLGGALSYHRFDLAGLKADQLRADLIAKVSAHNNIQLLLNATCNGWFVDNYLPIIQGKRLYKSRAKQCIVASGAFEQHVVFRNNDLPGIVLTSAAMRMMKHYGIKPGKRAVVLTGNDDGYLAALELAQNGVVVQALVDMRGPDTSQATELHNALTDVGIKLYLGSTVYQAIPNRDKNHLCAVDIRAIQSPGKVAQSGEEIACDLLCTSSGYMPAYQLLCQAGAKLSYQDELAQFHLEKLPANLHMAGSVNGIHQLDRVLEDGAMKAALCLQALGLANQDVEANEVIEPLSSSPTVNFSWPIFLHPKGKEFVDFDEDLQAQDIVNATRLGYRDIQLVKRFSTVGMGPSQGRHSALPTARLVAQATQRSVTETGVTTARPPFVAEKLAHLAGRIFNPYRRTAMHHRHLALGAKMIPAGSWQRPAYYGAADQRDACIQAEAMQVRNRVGMIDVSTLGGIEVRGPDAAEFINRIYTFAFLKQPVGKTRYAVLTNEQGVVIDDGVSCRLADEHFYVTATTTGVDAVYRSMTQWNAQWRLSVDISNVTSAFAAVNVAGPLSRKVMEKVCDDVDFSRDAFPYLASRVGTIHGVPVRLMRVGFVGELGYEVHMPALSAEAIWDLLMAAGEEFDMQPFGVETQRLLRLEKGHIIVGQDSDGMSHPGELSLAWAISRNKPFYVGCRSVDIVMARPQSRELVGFRLPKESPKPLEGQLVLAEGSAPDRAITGNVTSCEYSSAVDAIIGMAYVGIEQKEIGSRIPIRIENGTEVLAEVVSLPFYDPQNTRQEL